MRAHFLPGVDMNRDAGIFLGNFRRGLVASLCLLTVASCDAREPTAPFARVAPKYVTGAAAAAVGQDGRFMLLKGEAGPYPEISEELAVKLAIAFVHDYARIGRGYLEEERGGPVHLDLLKPCSRSFYVRSAYDPVPAEVSVFTRKVLGAQWLVPFCAGATAEVMVAVSAHAWDTEFGTGEALLPNTGSANFMMEGLPAGVEIPLSPEAAVNLAGQSTGRLINRVPELTMRPRPKGPMLAVWSISMDGPASFSRQATGREFETSAIFVGPFDSWQPRMLHAKTDLELIEPESFVDPGSVRSDGVDYPFTVNRRAGLNATLEVVRRVP